MAKNNNSNVLGSIKKTPIGDTTKARPEAHPYELSPDVAKALALTLVDWYEAIYEKFDAININVGDLKYPNIIQD